MNNRQSAKPLAAPERPVTAYIEAEQRQGRMACWLNAFGVASLLPGPCFQYAFLRYFTEAEPFPLTDAQFVVDTVTMLTKGLEQS